MTTSIRCCFPLTFFEYSLTGSTALMMETVELVAEYINLRPDRPEKYSGKRDFLLLNTWIYKLEQYVVFMKMSKPRIPHMEYSLLMFA